MRPYLRAANVTWDGLALDDVKEMNFTPEEATVFELHANDIVLNEASGSPNEVGKPALYRGEIPGCCYQNHLLRVRPNTAVVSPTYLLRYFQYLARTGAFSQRSRGVGIHHLGAAALSTWPVPIPPLDEQERTVAAIDEQLIRLGSADALIVRAERRVGILRKAILQAAFAAPEEVTERPTKAQVRSGERVDDR